MSNYRPVSLLSTLGKVMEKIVFKHVYNYLVDHALITQYQSGFLPGVSTVSQLTELYHSFCQALSKKEEVRVCIIFTLWQTRFFPVTTLINSITITRMQFTFLSLVEVRLPWAHNQCEKNCILRKVRNGHAVPP